MRPPPQYKPEDVVPLAEYMPGCIRWANMLFAMSGRARMLGLDEMAERFYNAGEDIFNMLERRYEGTLVWTMHEIPLEALKP